MYKIQSTRIKLREAENQIMWGNHSIYLDTRKFNLPMKTPSAMQTLFFNTNKTLFIGVFFLNNNVS